MKVDVTCGRRLRRWLCVVWTLTFIALAGCAGATPEASPTPSPILTIPFTDTPSATVASPTLAVATASPGPLLSATSAASATPTVAVSATSAASATTAPTTAPPTATARPTAAEFTPQVVQVWNTALVGADSMQGTCGNSVTPVYGLVQITPQGNTLIWKNQEPAPYTMTRSGANVWQYSGPTSIGDGTVTMVVQFTSATTLQLTRTFVASAEPNCTHVHYYTGVFQWNR